MKQKTKKYLGFLLVGGVLVGGVASAFYFSVLPGADKIKTGGIIYSADIMNLSNGLSDLDARTVTNAENIATNLSGISGIKTVCNDGEFMKGYDADGNKICLNFADEISGL